eukprot:TRINITY_DN45062_c0_g1_i1.p1 TRINITY_DN45062_c0_g1~~TRINITY_DN45062_c0_g1_i1.p1  ORF type:complete len:297 (-),score=7.29 TRINITY_DN45062_c0_g1_i1:78-968(-)
MDLSAITSHHNNNNHNHSSNGVVEEVHRSYTDYDPASQHYHHPVGGGDHPPSPHFNECSTTQQTIVYRSVASMESITTTTNKDEEGQLHDQDYIDVPGDDEDDIDVIEPPPANLSTRIKAEQTHQEEDMDDDDVFPTSPIAIDISAMSSNASRVLSRTTDIRPTVDRLRRTLSAPTRRRAANADEGIEVPDREAILSNNYRRVIKKQEHQQYDDIDAPQQHYESDHAAIIRHVLTQPHLLHDLSAANITTTNNKKDRDHLQQDSDGDKGGEECSLMAMFLDRELSLIHISDPTRPY